MALDDIIAESDELLHNGLDNSPTDAVRLLHELAKCLQQHIYATSHTAHTHAEELHRLALETTPDPRRG